MKHIDDIVELAKKYPNLTGYTVGPAVGAALVWFMNKYLKKKDKISLMNGALLGSLAGRAGAEAYSVMRDRASEKTAQVWGHFAPAHDADAARGWHKNTAPVAGVALKAIGRGAVSSARTLKNLGEYLSRTYIRPSISDVNSMISAVR